MDRFTYAAIAPLVEQRERVGLTLNVVFRCPATGARAAASRALPDAGSPPPARLGRLRRWWWFLREWLLAPLLRPLRRLAERLGLPARRTHPPEEVATVAAFRTVSDLFHWDDVAERWVAKVDTQHPGLGGRYRAQLEAAPVSQPRDRHLLERMLLEVAAADGRWSPVEEEFLAALLGDDVWPPRDRHLADDPLTPSELERASPGPVRETMVLLGWVLALSDGLSPAETRCVDMLASALGIDDPRLRALRGIAQEALFEEQLHLIQREAHDEAEAHAQALRAAIRLELDPDRAGSLAAVHRQLEPLAAVAG